MNKFLIAILCLLEVAGRAQDPILQLVLVSDVHYGITRTHFRHADSVRSTIVNKAMVMAINNLPMQTLPGDDGIGANQKIGSIEALMITGDIANRAEKGIQSAAVSWAQFQADYIGGLTTMNRDGRPTAIWLTTGNHDVSNAIGYVRPLDPAHDASSLAGIYNSMLHPAHPRTKDDYNYATDKIHFSKNIGGLPSPTGVSPGTTGSPAATPGIHLLFVNMWPDSTERAWIDGDLQTIPAGTPVLLFTHSMPDVESRFFTNPNGDHSINQTDNFENLLSEQFKDGASFTQPALIEQRSLDSFLRSHPTIQAWFHGHSNYNEFYDWHGPANDLNLHCFRVDSPMKGKYSSKDETILSFQVITIDTRTNTMTVRECRWNTSPDNPSLLQWGQHTTIHLLQ